MSMNSYQRIFGTGPRGLLLSLVLLAITRFIAPDTPHTQISADVDLSRFIFILFSLVTLGIIFWSIRSLPPSKRGKELCTSGALHYLRHPLYGAFLSCFNFGLAFLFNNWIYIIWALLLHPLWHWNVRAEEKLMMREFPLEYDAYKKRTGRFFPRLLNLRS